MAIYPTATLYPGAADAYPAYFPIPADTWVALTDTQWTDAMGETWNPDTDDAWGAH